MKQKVKRALIQYYKPVTVNDYNKLGRAINWRFDLIDNLPQEKLLDTVPGFCVIQRQVEFELGLYQQELQNLAQELENEQISQSEFEDRLENLTIAILILAFLAGSEIDNQELFDSAAIILQSGGIGDDLDLSSLPEQAQNDLNSEIAIALGAGSGLSEAIASGDFEDNQEGLFSRLALWVTTALGIVSLGKLFLDNQRFQIWLYSPLKKHCDDCAALNGQVHTVKEWNDFFVQTGKRPQGPTLACGGFRCGCGLFNTDGPSIGNFV